MASILTLKACWGDPEGLNVLVPLHNSAQAEALKYTRDRQIIDCKVNIMGISDDSICVIVSLRKHPVFLNLVFCIQLLENKL